MATILDKDLTRESTVKVNEREVQVTLTADQTVSMKLKRMKTGVVSIGIEQLYNQLSGGPSTGETKSVVIDNTRRGQKKEDADMMISLHDIRHRLNVSGFDYSVTVKLDGILRELIEDRKKA